MYLHTNNKLGAALVHSAHHLYENTSTPKNLQIRLGLIQTDKHSKQADEPPGLKWLLTDQPFAIEPRFPNTVIL